PLSDMTNIAAIGAGAELFDHIRHMLWTAGPSVLACVVVYLAAGAGGDGTGPPTRDANGFLAGLDAAFSLHPVVLLPPVVGVWAIARRFPAAPAITLSAAVAVALGVLVQGFGLQAALTAAVTGFEPRLLAARGLDPAAVDPRLLTLVQRGGIFSMATTLVIVFAAFLLTGAMEAYGALDRLIRGLRSAARGVFGLVAATMAAGATMIGLTSHGGVTALVIGGLFQSAYDERGLARVNLSRSIEDSVTLTEPLMPWTVSAVFMAGTLGVATIDYLPWAVFNYGGPLFSLLIAALYRRTGTGIKAAGAGGP
ncbi:MAG: Na+/H+ antiporter NhaC family protein, partial [Gemmatimonadota bacterium]